MAQKQSIRNPFLLILRNFLGRGVIWHMINNEFLMNAYPAQRSHRAKIFFDQFLWIFKKIQVSVN